MRPDDILLSAYLDGEVPAKYIAEIEACRERDPECRARLAQLENLHRLLHQDEVPGVSERMAPGFASITRRLSVRSRSSIGIHWRQIQVPLPAIAAAAVVVVALAAVVIWSFIPKSPVSAPDYLAQGKNVDVTIRVDDADMENVLQWLADKQMLGEISIQLPEQQFQIVGEPVLLKSAQYPEGFAE